MKALVIQSISVNPSISLLSIPLVVTMKASVLFLIRWDIFEKIIKSLSFPCCAVSKNTPPNYFLTGLRFLKFRFLFVGNLGMVRKSFMSASRIKKNDMSSLKQWLFKIGWDENIIKNKYSKCVHMLVSAKPCGCWHPKPKLSHSQFIDMM